MKNIRDVLDQKLREYVRVKKELEALRIVAPMLTEERDLPIKPPLPEPTTVPDPSADDVLTASPPVKGFP